MNRLFFALLCGLSLLGIFNTSVKAAPLTEIISVTASNGTLVIKFRGEKPKTIDSIIPSKKNGQSKFVVDFKNSSILTRSLGGDDSFSSLDVRIGQFDKKTSRIVVEGETKALTGATVQNSGNTFTVKLPKFKPVYVSSSHSTNPYSPSQAGATGKPNSTNSTKENKENKQLKTDKLNNSEYVEIENGAYTKITIRAKKLEKIKYQILNLEDPNRLVLDLIDWEAEPSKMSQPKEISSLVGSVRAGYPYKKSKTVRMVFDLLQKGEEYEAISQGKELIISIFPAGYKREAPQIPVAEKEKKRKHVRVLIDPGHGGYDSGAIYSGIEEKNLNTAITQKIKEILPEKGKESDFEVEVILTRNSDIFLSLDERVEMIKKYKPDIFVSVHCNALNSVPDIKGIETYYYNDTSKRTAAIIHKEVLATTETADRRFRKARFVVIRETEYPSVLVECGFMTNKNELAALKTASYQRRIAEGIANGIIKYLSETKD